MVSGSAAGSLDDQTAALREQVLTRLGFQFPPDRMRASDQWRVGLTLTDRLAGDPRVPMGRAVDVWRRESIDANGMDPAPRELVQRCSTSRTEADNRHVVHAHGRSLLPWDRGPGALLHR